MLESLRLRLVAGSIYSYVGDVLVSLNPFAPVPLYGADRCHYYSLNSALENLEDPHVYAIALQAFRALSRTRENQACVISGESGAGKTETAKFFVGHLLELSRTENVGMTYKYDVLQVRSACSWSWLARSTSNGAAVINAVRRVLSVAHQRRSAAK